MQQNTEDERFLLDKSGESLPVLFFSVWCLMNTTEMEAQPGGCSSSLHAQAEALHLPVEVLGGLAEDQVGGHGGVPDAPQALGHLLHQVVDGVTLHEDPLVRVEVDTLLGHSQDLEAGAT